MQEFVGGHLSSTCLSSVTTPVWPRNWDFNQKMVSKVTIHTCSHLVFRVPCRRSSGEAVLLHIWAVTGMHFPNHLTSRAYLCFERSDLDFKFLVATDLHKLGSVWSRALWHLPLCFCSCFDSLRGLLDLSVCLWVAFRLRAHADGGD